MGCGSSAVEPGLFKKDLFPTLDFEFMPLFSVNTILPHSQGTFSILSACMRSMFW